MEATARKLTLIELADELDQIAIAFDQLAESGEETGVLQAIENYFGDLLEGRDKKLDAYAGLISSFEAHAAIRKAEAKRLSDLAKTDENNAKRLKERLKFYFDANGITKMETPLHKFAVQANGGVVPVLVSIDANELPTDYQRVTVAPDVDRLRETLESGVKIEGCELGERGSHLRIR